MAKRILDPYLGSDLYLGDKSIDFLIENLQFLKSEGYSLDAPPLEPLLQVMIDLALQVSYRLKEQGSWKGHLNPTIKEFDYSDELGNTKMVSIPGFSVFKANPEGVLFFKRIAEEVAYFVRFQKVPIQISSLEKNSKNLDSVPSSKERKKQTSSSSHYYARKRRQKAKQTKHKDH